MWSKRAPNYLAVAATFILGLSSVNLAFAQNSSEYPNKPITIVVPFAAGGTTDISARKLGSLVEERVGQPVVIQNQPGGSGTNALRMVSRKKADGYTVVAITSSPVFVTPALRPVGYDPVKDFTAIMNYSGPVHGILVDANSKYDSFEDLLNQAKNGQKVTYGTSGALSGANLAFDRLAKEIDANLEHIPFDSASKAIAGVLGHHVDVALVPAYKDLVTSGKLKLLGVIDENQDEDFPEAKTLKQMGYDIAFPSIVGIAASSNTPNEIVDYLENAFTEAASSEEFAKFMQSINQPVRIFSGEELQKLIAENLKAYQEQAKSMKLSK